MPRPGPYKKHDFSIFNKCVCHSISVDALLPITAFRSTHNGVPNESQVLAEAFFASLLGGVCHTHRKRDAEGPRTQKRASIRGTVGLSFDLDFHWSQDLLHQQGQELPHVQRPSTNAAAQKLTCYSLTRCFLWAGGWPIQARRWLEWDSGPEEPNRPSDCTLNLLTCCF